MTNYNKLECGPMPNVMVALPNIGGALCSTPQSLANDVSQHWHTISDVSTLNTSLRHLMSHKNPQRLTVVTETFITLSYGLVLGPTSIVYSLFPVNNQLIVTRLTCT